MNNEEIFTTLSRLTEAYREYYKTSPQTSFDLQSFSLWLYNSETNKKLKNSEQTFGGKELDAESLHGTIDDQISFILLNLQRLIKFYAKKAIEGTKLVGIDDIHFLLYLAHTDSMKKSEIINTNVTEMSSGIEVIKRLIKNELIEDFDDPDDKRSKRVKITPKGMEEVKRINSKFGNIHRLITSPFREEEKFSFLAGISKLYNYHVNIFNTEKNSKLEDLLRKYLNDDGKDS